MTDKPATRATLLELREDRRVVDEGYKFLDEKRIALAQELLRQLVVFKQQQLQLAEQEYATGGALAGAIERHGLEGLQVQPVAAEVVTQLNLQVSPFLGVTLIREADVQTATSADSGRTPSREGERCTREHHELVECGVAMAATTANLLRLATEYQRTERRVRALENIIQPELQRDERRVQDVLDEQEQEELIRARRFARRLK